MTDDHEILRCFVEERSETAFRQLVERYLPMVLGVALRRTRDRELSEEIAQNVFTILARRADGLRAGAGLAGWLHRTAVFQTAKAIRSEARHLRKVQALSDSMNENDNRHNHAELNEALPLLDEAVDQLSKRDREVLLLRFFEGRSFKEIAPMINGTEASGQKRARRALAKLAAILKRKGVVVPVAVLSAGLASSVALPKSTVALSGSLAGTISKSALASVSAISNKTVITNICLNMSHTKTIAAIGLLVLVAIPLGAQRMEIASVRSDLAESEIELRELRISATETERAAARAAADDWKRGRAERSDAGQLDPYALLNEIERVENGSMVAMVALEKKLKALDANELLELKNATLTSDLTKPERKRILPVLLEKLMKFEPDGATKTAIEFIGGGENNDYSRMFGTVRSGMQAWVKDDPDGAVAWLKRKAASGDFEFKSLNGTSSVDAAWGAAIAGLIVSDEDGAIESFAGLGKKAAEEALRQIAWGDAFDTLDRDVFVELARSMPTKGSEARAYAGYARSIAKKRSFAEAAEFVGQQDHLEDVQIANLMLSTAKQYSEATPSQATERLDWLVNNLPQKYAGRSVGEFLGALSMNGHHQLAVGSLERLEGSTIRDKAVASFLDYSDWSTGRDELVSIAQTIEDPELREKALERGRSK